MTESFKYEPENAETYKALGIEGTSFEPSYKEAEKMLGDLSGKTVLDFGSGAGRSSRFLKGLGAKLVIGVEHNETMVDEASTEEMDGIEYHLIDKELPLSDASVDSAFASQVFMEMSSVDDMTAAMTEIARVLKPESEFILIVTNPKAWGHDFVSYNYPDSMEDVKSGDTLRCIIKGEQPFTITDYYWVEDDYKEALEASGFVIEEMTYPMPEPGEWLDETVVAPDIVIRARKNKE
jgi:SAM-dependent methyltransferase